MHPGKDEHYYRQRGLMGVQSFKRPREKQKKKQQSTKEILVEQTDNREKDRKHRNVTNAVPASFDAVSSTLMSQLTRALPSLAEIRADLSQERPDIKEQKIALLELELCHVRDENFRLKDALRNIRQFVLRQTATDMPNPQL